MVWPKGQKRIDGGCMLGKHHTEETKRKMKEKRLGKKNSFFGKHHSIKTKKKLSNANKGKKFRLGKIHSEETKQKIRLAHLGKFGKNSNHWKGGITSLLLQVRTCFKYRQWRSDVFTRDNFICQNCFKQGGNLEAHHIKRFSIIIAEYNIKTLEEALNCEELWNINNGTTLCKNCHYQLK